MPQINADERRFKWGRPAPFLLMAVLFVVVFGCSVCGDEKVLHSPSPNGVLAASTFVRNCGATTDYATWITLHRKDEKFNRSEDLLFVAKFEHGIELLWADNQHLSVRCRSCRDTDIYRQVVRIGDIRISYSFQ